jgi:hypothetical protein
VDPDLIPDLVLLTSQLQAQLDALATDR